MSPDDVFVVSQSRLAPSTPSPGGLLCAAGRRCVMDAGSGPAIHHGAPGSPTVRRDATTSQDQGGGHGNRRRQAHVRQRRSVHARHASRGGAVSRAWPHAVEGVATSLREGSRGDRAHCRLVGGACLRAARCCGGRPLPRGTHTGRAANGLLCAARRQPRRLLPASPLQPPARLDSRHAPRLLKLRLAREAQHRPPHLHEHRRLRRRRQAGAVGSVRAVAGASAVVPVPAPLHLADVHADGLALADRRRPRRVCAWHCRKKRTEECPAAGTLLD